MKITRGQEASLESSKGFHRHRKSFLTVINTHALKSMKIHENILKSFEIRENQWKSTKC